MTNQEREIRERNLNDKYNALTVHVVIALLKTVKDHYGSDKYDEKIATFKTDDSYKELKKLSKQVRYREWLSMGVREWRKNHSHDEGHWCSVTEADMRFLRDPKINIKKHIDTEMANDFTE